jgi:DNA-binding MarR family transcriptional regulator
MLTNRGRKYYRRYGLSPFQLVVLDAILQFAENGVATVGYRALAAESGASVPTVVAATRQLAKKGLLRIETSGQRGGSHKSHKYHLAPGLKFECKESAK